MLNAATDFKDPLPPKKDDMGVCCYCASINVFNADLTLRPMTDQEISELPHDIRQELNRARKIVLQMKD
jgi:hypothetical protein